METAIVPRSILITGATGFLGSHLVVEFLMRKNVTLYCLARGKKDVSARERIEKALETAWIDRGEETPFGAFLEAAGNSLVVWSQDLETLLQGTAPMARLDEIWHLAAKVDFLEHRREETFRNNVEGTRNLMRLAETTGATAFNYFSTAFVAGQKAGIVREDDDPGEWEPNNPYEASKRAAEKLVLDWGESSGRLVRVLRPSIIVGHSRTFRADSPYGLYGFLALMLRLRDDLRDRMPEYFLHNPIRLQLEPEASLNLICIDHVVACCMRLAAVGPATAGIFHLCNPQAVALSELFKPASESMHVMIRAEVSEQGLNPVDFLLNQHTRIFNCYLKNMKAFSMVKTLDAVGLEKGVFALNPEMQSGLVREFVGKYAALKENKAHAVKTAARTLRRVEIIRADGQPLAYFAGGTGDRTLVIINAYGQSLAFWDWVVAHFSSTTKILMWQARGTTSGSGGLKNFYPVSVHVEDLGAILENEGTATCDILGWCTGPKLALEFYALHPEKVRSMVFLTGAFKGHKGMETLNTKYESHMEPLCRMVAANPDLAGSLIETLKSVLVGRAKVPEASAEGNQEESRARILDVLTLVNKNLKPLVIEPFLTEQSVVSYARQLIDFWEHDVAGILGTVAVPVLFIAGELDNIASPAISRAVSGKVPESVYLEIKGGSHYPHHDNHELLNEILESFHKNPAGFEFSHDMVQSEKSGALVV
jgi:nucleoside-diphosphate-sugar epimerase/pimeloyl-ACP methyl ester carboxylesterase